MKKSFLLLIILMVTTGIQAQNDVRAKIGVLAIEANNVQVPQSYPENSSYKGDYQSILFGNIVRLELEKLDTFQVIDKHEIFNLMSRHRLQVDSCYALSCLLKAGELLDADMMLTGSIEQYGSKLVLILRLIDVNSGNIIRSQIDEYLDLKEDIQMMVNISVRKMFGHSFNEVAESSLSSVSEYETVYNNPNVTRMVNNGPRIGVQFATGDLARRISDPENKGGLNGYPLFTMLAYQREVQYLNEGRFQGLFEFIFSVTGLDQGLFIPGFTLLHGFRDNMKGWEFALGPTMSLAPMTKGIYLENEFYTYMDVLLDDNFDNPEDMPFSYYLYKGGKIRFTSAFVFAIGKTFRSGRVNIPLNLYVIPNRKGWRVGVTFGFNAKKRRDR